MRNLSCLVLWMVSAWALSTGINWAAGFAASLLLPIAYRLPGRNSMILGSISLFVVWLVQSLYNQWGDQTELTRRIAGLFGLRSGTVLVFLAALIGAVGGGLFGWAGAETNRLVDRTIRRQKSANNEQ